MDDFVQIRVSEVVNGHVFGTIDLKPLSKDRQSPAQLARCHASMMAWNWRCSGDRDICGRPRLRTHPCWVWERGSCHPAHRARRYAPEEMATLVLPPSHLPPLPLVGGGGGGTRSPPAPRQASEPLNLPLT